MAFVMNVRKTYTQNFSGMMNNEDKICALCVISY
jgi:hypothetical protein